MKSPSRDLERQRSMQLPEPAAPPAATEALAPPKKPDTAEPAGTQKPDDEKAEPAASATATASAAPPTSTSAAAAVGTSPSTAPEVDTSVVDAGAATAPDAGWQKPDWAIPDNEIPIRRGPGEPEEKIVLPPEPSAHP
jgi:hypothetical protein